MRPRIRPRVLFVILFVFASAFAHAQGTTGALAGTVTHDGAPLPGVTVTIASPALQGQRVAYTNANGDYVFLALPPGAYAVRFEMQGLQVVRQETKVGLASNQRVDAVMQHETVAEAMTVVAADRAMIESTDIQTNLESTLVESLPVSRTIQGAIDLAPGVTTTSTGAIVVGGAYTYDTLYLINGGVTNENIRGQTDNLYIEDAIQEITVMTGAISAEYGRFTGGVVSVITKSGGNDFSGSLRSSFTNAAWTEPSAWGEPNAESDVNETWETTLGGRIVRDRLWFFGAGRRIESTPREFYTNSGEEFAGTDTDERFEIKLTAQMNPKHSVVGSYLLYEVDQVPHCGFGCWEPSAVDQDGRQVPREFVVARYNGILSTDLLVEAGYSSRDLRFVDSGGTHRTTDYSDARDIALGTAAYDFSFGGTWGAPYFCEPCGEEIRENEAVTLKGTWYLATRALGTHNMVVGYENFAESRFLENYQSGSDFTVYSFFGGLQTRVGPAATAGTLRPLIGRGDLILYYPVDTASQGSDWVTRSLFANDKWDVGSKWSFNLGVRYDENDGRDALGNRISKDSNVSPRLGASLDVRGDGRFRVNASYSRYVSRIQETIGDEQGGGMPSYYLYYYDGPTIGGPDTGLASFDVLEQLFAWLLAQGWSPTNRVAVPSFGGAGIQGLNIRMDGTLQSPYVDEVTVGFSSQLGQRGFVRLDYIDKEWGDFYVGSTTPGDVALNNGEPLDVITIRNCSGCRERSYHAWQLQASYRFSNRLLAGGNYTWSETRGNILGEQSNAAVWDNILTYTEYNSFEQHRPTGPLPNDQTHKLRLWLGYDIPLGKYGNLNVSLLERFDSGRPYEAIRAVNIRPYVACHPCGYAQPPFSRQYFFSDRGAYRWEDATATDVALNYEVPISTVSVFIQGEVLNLFNEQAQIGGSAAIRVLPQPFDPFTETPVEGIHWEKLANFGQPTSPGSYQQPRTYRFSLGVRF